MSAFGGFIRDFAGGVLRGVAKRGWISMRTVDENGEEDGLAHPDAERCTQHYNGLSPESQQQSEHLDELIKRLSSASALAAGDKRVKSSSDAMRELEKPRVLKTPSTTLMRTKWRWRQLWCELANGCLYAYNNKRDRSLECVITLAGSAIDEEDVFLPEKADESDPSGVDAQHSSGPLGVRAGDRMVRVLRVSPLDTVRGASGAIHRSATMLSFFTQNQRDQWLTAIVDAASSAGAPYKAPSEIGREQRGSRISTTASIAFPSPPTAEEEFMSLLRSEQARSDLLHFMESEMNSELLSFWMDLDHLELTMPASLPQEVMNRMVAVIASRYIVDAAPMEINISGRMKRDIIERIALTEASQNGETGNGGALGLHVFTAARAEVLKIIQTDVYPRFARSPRGRLTCLEFESLIAGGVLKNGWMYKQSGFNSVLNVKTNWTRRFYVLTTSSLRYFRDDSMEEERGRLALADVKEVRDTSGGDTVTLGMRPHSLTIYLHGGKSLSVSAEDDYQKREMLRILHDMHNIYRDIVREEFVLKRRRQRMRLTKDRPPTNIFDEMLERPKSVQLERAIMHANSERLPATLPTSKDSASVLEEIKSGDEDKAHSKEPEYKLRAARNGQEILDSIVHQLAPFLFAQHLADIYTLLSKNMLPRSKGGEHLPILLSPSASRSMLGLLDRTRRQLIMQQDEDAQTSWLRRVARVVEASEARMVSTNLDDVLRVASMLRRALHKIAENELNLLTDKKERARRNWNKLRHHLAKAVKQMQIDEVRTQLPFSPSSASAAAIHWEGLLEEEQHTSAKSLSESEREELIRIKEGTIVHLFARMEASRAWRACLQSITEELFGTSTFGTCESCGTSLADCEASALELGFLPTKLGEHAVPLNQSLSRQTSFRWDKIGGHDSAALELMADATVEEDEGDAASESADRSLPLKWLHLTCADGLKSVNDDALVDGLISDADLSQPSGPEDDGARRSTCEQTTFDCDDDVDAEEDDAGPTVCATCKDVCNPKECIFALDRYWHPEHFHCSDCGTHFDVGATYCSAACEADLPDSEKRPLCKRCAMHPRNMVGPEFLESMGDPDAEVMHCGLCGECINVDAEEELFLCMGSAVHKDCFRCRSCSCQLRDKFFAVEKDVDAQRRERELASACDDGGAVADHSKELMSPREGTAPKGRGGERAARQGSHIAIDRHLYCEECTRDQIAKRCELCQEPILGVGADGEKARVAGERWWHQKCFRCCDCDTVLVEGMKSFLDKGQLCCETHMRERLRVRMEEEARKKGIMAPDGQAPRNCEACGESLLGRPMLGVKGRFWHRDCFCCSDCATRIEVGSDGSVRAAFTPDGAVHCVDCVKEMQRKAKEEAEARRRQLLEDQQQGRLAAAGLHCCRHCEKSIATGSILSVKGFHWHGDCFVCENPGCGAKIDPAKVMVLQDLDERYGVVFCSSACVADALQRQRQDRARAP